MDECCPNCSAIWGLHEMEWQRCDCCGYPNVNEDNFPDEDDFEEEEDYTDFESIF